MPPRVKTLAGLSKAFRLHRNSPYKLCPSTFELLALCSIGAGVGQRLLPRTRRGGFVALSFPSFTYLTAAALSYVVFPFTFLVSFDPIRAVDHRDSRHRWISPTPPIGTPCFHFDGFWLRLFGGIMLDGDTQITRWRSSTNCCRTVCVFVCTCVWADVWPEGKDGTLPPWVW